jgi:5,10-methylenetetrahydrofolate reductase
VDPVPDPLLLRKICQNDNTFITLFIFASFQWRMLELKVDVKNAVFRDVMPCGSFKNRRLGGT